MEGWNAIEFRHTATWFVDLLFPWLWGFMAEWNVLSDSEIDANSSWPQDELLGSGYYLPPWCLCQLKLKAIDDVIESKKGCT
jgi:hypothetical protein